MKRHRTAAGALALAMCLVACSGGSEQQLAAGSSALDKGDVKSAVISFKSVLQQSPDNATARHLLGRALSLSGDPVAAAVELRKAFDLGYPKPEVAPELARALLLSGQAKKVIDDLGTLDVGTGLPAADLRTSIATAHAQLGQSDQAAKLLAQVLQSQPDFAAARLLKVRFLLRDNDVDGALSLAAEVARQAPDNVEAHLLSGDIRLRVKADPVGAERAYLEASRVQPSSARAHSALFTLYMQQKDLDKARAQLAKLKAEKPQLLQTRLHEAQIAAADKQYPAAREILQQLLHQASDNVDVLYLAGVVESNLGNVRSARGHFTKALNNSPRRLDLRALLANTYLQTNQPQQVLDLLKDVLASDRAGAPLLEMAAKASMQLGDFGRARDLFLRARRVAPENIAVQAALAMLDYTTGDVDGALRQLQTISSQGPDTTADYALVSIRAQQGDFDGALRAIDALQAKKVTPANLSLLRGRVELQRGSRAAARQQFEQALAVQPTLLAAVMALADLDMAEGRYTAALARFDTLLKAEPQNAAALMESARVMSGAGASKEKVVERLTAAVKADPNDMRLRASLVDYLLVRRDAKAAVVVAQAGLVLNPNSEEILERLGRAHLQSGDVQQSISTFRKLAALRPKVAEPYFMLAEAYVAANDLPAAEAVLRQSLVVAPDNIGPYRELSRFLQKTGKTDAALALVRTLQKRLPKNAGGYLLESELHAKTKNHAAGAAVLRTGLAATQDSEIAVRLHRFLVAANRPADAAAFASEWLGKHPADGGFRRALADIAMQAHGYVEAERLYLEVVKLNPVDAAALNNLAWIRSRQGKADALGYAERAVTLQGANPAYLDTLAHVLVRLKQGPRAAELAKQILAMQGIDAALQLSAIDVLAQSGADQALAQAELEKFTKAAGNADPFLRAEIARIRQSMAK